MKVTIVLIVIGALGPNNNRIIKRSGGLGTWLTGRDYPNDSIVKNGQNPETSPGDMERLAVTQTYVKKSKGVKQYLAG